MDLFLVVRPAILAVLLLVIEAGVRPLQYRPTALLLTLHGSQ
jgi:hypothetical protein